MADERESQREAPVEALVEAPGHQLTHRAPDRSSSIREQGLAAADRILHPANDLVYVGMGDGAKGEAAHLRKLTGDKVVTAMDTAKDDTIAIGNRSFDLTNEQDVSRYLQTIGVPEVHHAALAALMQDVVPDSRDEIAQVIRIFWEAEHGDRVMERLVLSGHSSGASIWGDNNGLFLFEYLARLAKLFPKAAGQLNHIMLAACNTGGGFSLQPYNAMFPNLDSIWAYIERSPGAASGATGHMRVWNRATQDKDVAEMAGARGAVAKHRDGDNVVTWTKAEGYKGGKTLELEQAVAEVEALEYNFNRFYYGDAELADPHAGPLRDYYQAVLQLYNHNGLPDAERARWDVRKNVTLRLLFFNNVRVKFGDRYKSQLDAGYKAADLPQPKWKTITRRVAFFEASTLAARCVLIGASAADEAHRLVQTGLVELSDTVIPENFA